MQSIADNREMGFGNHGGVCTICLDKTVLQETALIKGCEHAYWFVLIKSLTFLLCYSKWNLGIMNSVIMPYFHVKITY